MTSPLPANTPSSVPAYTNKLAYLYTIYTSFPFPPPAKVAKVSLNQPTENFRIRQTSKEGNPRLSVRIPPSHILQVNGWGKKETDFCSS